jgi:hypothetical protein
MLIRVYVLLLSCLLVGCATKSAVTELQQSTSPQQAPSPQQPAPTAASNTTTEQPQQNVNAETGAANLKSDACSLITKSEIETVQGEPVKETKGSNHASGSFAVSRCFYSLASFNKSVSLEVTRASADKAGQAGPKEFWNNTFHKKEEKKEREEEEERERAEKKGKGEREEEEEEGGGEPRPVPGVGDEAFWSGNQKAGALYVLKNNAFIRISIGGAGDESAKIDKSKALAQKAIGRL